MSRCCTVCDNPLEYNESEICGLCSANMYAKCGTFACKGEGKYYYAEKDIRICQKCKEIEIHLKKHGNLSAFMKAIRGGF